MNSKMDPAGYYVEVADNGPWLTLDGKVTPDWSERGVWPSKEKAESAIADSLNPAQREEQ